MIRSAMMAGESPDPARAVPACQICGCQDDTLRLVVYPVVISFLLVTFRRSYSGTFCQHHRGLRWLMASAISSLVGWIGFPIGLFKAPAALFQLAQGGEQPRAANARLLKSIAEHKAQSNDLPSAARCLEASLEYQDCPQVRERLRHIYRTETLRRSVGPVPDRIEQAAQILSFMVFAAGLGLAAGLANFYLFRIAVAASSAGILVLKAILVGSLMTCLGILAVTLARIHLDRLFQQVKIRHEFLAVGLGLVTGGFLAYGFPTGWAAGRFFDRVFSGSLPLTADQLFPAAFNTLTRGGLTEIGNLLTRPSVPGTIYLILLAFFLVYALFLLETGTRQAAARQRLLAEVRLNHGHPSSDFSGWAALGMVPLALLFLISFIH
jgi:hypothetical protein